MTKKQRMMKVKKLADEITKFLDDEKMVGDMGGEEIQELVVARGVLTDLVVKLGGPAWSEDEGWVY